MWKVDIIFQKQNDALPGRTAHHRKKTDRGVSPVSLAAEAASRVNVHTRRIHQSRRDEDGQVFLEVQFDIVPAQLGDDAPLWGAVALALLEGTGESH